MKSLPVEKILPVVDEFGMPHILVQTFGFMVQIIPDSFTFDGTYIKFYKLSSLVCCISVIEDINLLEQPRPSNMLVKCRRCYSIIEEERHVGYLFWPEEEGRKDIKDVSLIDEKLEKWRDAVYEMKAQSQLLLSLSEMGLNNVFDKKTKKVRVTSEQMQELQKCFTDVLTLYNNALKEGRENDNICS